MRKKENSSAQGNQFLSLPEVQSYLGIKSRKTVLKYITTGKLKAYKVGGTRWRIAAEDVEAFLRAQIVDLAQQDATAVRTETPSPTPQPEVTS